MRFASVCSGIEAASVAWEPLGWECAFLSEIEPFPRAVLAHRFPHVPNLGDFTKIGAKDVGPEPVDLLVGGTPCQDFSVAGLRAGLDGKRGQLTIEFVSLLGRLWPRWVVWENVPGVLSADGGRAFGTFLGEMAKCGYGFAYRVLDAQYFGVPQRRRRVFVVGYLGDWRRAAAVLFERESLCGDSPPVARTQEDVAHCVTSRFGSGRNDPTSESYVTHTLRVEGFDASEDGTGRGVPLVPQAFGWNKSSSQTMQVVGTTDALQASPSSNPAVCMGSVRRLTPRECERLQGFHDDWTAVPYRGKTAADGPRYRAIGNSMAVPVMRWIGERIQMVEDLTKPVSSVTIP